MNTQTVKKHIDGGTYKVLAFAETRNGWGIAVTEWTTYRNRVVFEVMRVSNDNKMFRLNTLDTERDARAYANKMWRQDR